MKLFAVNSNLCVFLDYRDVLWPLSRFSCSRNLLLIYFILLLTRCFLFFFPVHLSSSHLCDTVFLFPPPPGPHLLSFLLFVQGQRRLSGIFTQRGLEAGGRRSSLALPDLWCGLPSIPPLLHYPSFPLLLFFLLSTPAPPPSNSPFCHLFPFKHPPALIFSPLPLAAQIFTSPLPPFFFFLPFFHLSLLDGSVSHAFSLFLPARCQMTGL